MRMMSSLLCKTMRQWTIDLISHMFFNGIIFLNPRLSIEKKHKLMPITIKAVEQIFFQGCFDGKVLKDIGALASPDHNTYLFVSYLIETLVSLASTYDGLLLHLHLESPQESFYDDIDVSQKLLNDYGMSKIYIDVMPCEVRQAIYRAFKTEADKMEQLEEARLPICCISLEPLLQQNGMITMDVVAVIERHMSDGREHAFLYRGHALFDWMRRQQVPTSPETRSVIKPDVIYRLS